VKRWAVRRLDRSIGFVALPNRWAGRAVVPELRGVVRPEVLARELAGWLDDEARRAHLRQALEGLRGEPGAAQRVAARVLTLAQAGPHLDRRSVALRLLAQIRPHLRMALAGLLCMLVVSATELLLPLIFGQGIVNEVLSPQSSMTRVTQLVLVLVGLMTVRGL